MFNESQEVGVCTYVDARTVVNSYSEAGDPKCEGLAPNQNRTLRYTKNL